LDDPQRKKTGRLAKAGQVAADFADLIEANSAALASHLGAGRKCGPQAACL